MQKIIPFKKEMDFKDQVSEITSISLEHTLHKENNNLITGVFTVSGDYKVVDTSSVIDHFSFDLPFDIHMDDKYDLEKVKIDIDDFYYEIINSKSLSVNIDVLVDKIEEKKDVLEEELVREEVKEEMIKESSEDIIKEEEIEEDILDIGEKAKEVSMEEIAERKKFEEELEREDMKEKQETISVSKEENIEKRSSQNNEVESVSSIFNSFDNSVSVSSIYKVYIVREEDSIESILGKYKVSREEMEKYNSLKEIKKGDKLIIPTSDIEKV